MRQKIEIHGDLIYGVVMGFGQPSGWVITQGLGGAQEGTRGHFNGIAKFRVSSRKLTLPRMFHECLMECTVSLLMDAILTHLIPATVFRWNVLHRSPVRLP